MGSASPRGKPAEDTVGEPRTRDRQDAIPATASSSSSASAPAPAAVASSSSSSSASAPTPAKDPPEDDSLDRQIAACSEGSSTSSKPEVRLRACDDPALAVPPASREDWKAEVKKLRCMAEDPSISDEEKIRVLHEALQQRIEDSQKQDEVNALVLKRQAATQSEKDHIDQEVQRSLAMKLKLEASCRVQKELMDSLSKENQKIAEDEQHRHTELKDKFEQAIKDVQEKMDAELEVREHYLKENDDLRGKLQKFNETYEAQETQLAEQREAREREMQAAQERLMEHEVMAKSSKENATKLEKENEALRKSQTTLEKELKSVLNKFDEFSKGVSGSNQRHTECRSEVDTLQAHIEGLEKENADLKKNSKLEELVAEQQVMQKQRDALEKLCDNLQKARAARKLQ
eukprot:TRINITY_DN2427_c0_g3_i1.p1 TRINITY_DN2427_c0_g3~~TRINITY_DN2427_c0_g3_i1.p1  ORF type:complete len:420 (+),score=127.85 TRINITY_DN2427_c0_g3_i1:53-1261(+)